MSPKAKRAGKTKVVIDASVALKWQLDDEECVSQAVALRDDCLKKICRDVRPDAMALRNCQRLHCGFAEGTVPIGRGLSGDCGSLRYRGQAEDA